MLQAQMSTYSQPTQQKMIFLDPSSHSLKVIGLGSPFQFSRTKDLVGFPKSLQNVGPIILALFGIKGWGWVQEAIYEIPCVLDVVAIPLT